MMNNFWSRHPWLRRSTSGMLAFLVVVIIGLLSIAYVYMPPEGRTETPAYLIYLQDHYLDGYVNAVQEDQPEQVSRVLLHFLAA